jgi:hypothetical protein
MAELRDGQENKIGAAPRSSEFFTHLTSVWLPGLRPLRARPDAWSYCGIGVQVAPAETIPPGARSARRGLPLAHLVEDEPKRLANAGTVTTARLCCANLPR